MSYILLGQWLGLAIFSPDPYLRINLQPKCKRYCPKVHVTAQGVQADGRLVVG